MEWHFCYADWNCWATWFWSSSTAAWVQALLTAWVFFWSIRQAKKTFENDRELQRAQSHSEHQRTLDVFEHERELQRQQIEEDRQRIVYQENMVHHKNLVKAKTLILRLWGKANNLVQYIDGGIPGNPNLWRVALSDTLSKVRYDYKSLREVMLSDLPNPGAIVLLNNGVIMAEDLESMIVHALASNPPIEDKNEAQ